VSDEPTAEPVDESIDEPIDESTQEPEAEAPLDLFEVLTAERDAHLADLQRVSAEFANFRKQTDRRNAEVAARARADLAERILPVLDACDLAVDHGATDVAPIRAALVATLEPAGLEIIDPVDAPFDPTRHDAVMREPADPADAAADGDGEQTVVEVLRLGYAWAGRVVRPAMVKVRG
jgi:molecular chaperone GrpE